MTSMHPFLKYLITLTTLLVLVNCSGYQNCYVYNEDGGISATSSIIIQYESDLYRMTDFNEERDYISGIITPIRPSTPTAGHFIIHVSELAKTNITGGMYNVRIPHQCIKQIIAPDGQSLEDPYPVKLAIIIHELTSQQIATVTKHCPFVYDLQQPEMPLIGELFGGANLAPMERHDYLPLQNAAIVNNEIQLRVSNEVLQKQHNNLLEVVRVQHPANVEVFIDKYHRLQTISQVEAPVKAYTISGNNVLDLIAENDERHFTGDVSDLSSDGIILEYNIPDHISTAKLVLNAKNSFWLDHIIGQYHQLWGSKYKQWQQQQKKEDASTLLDWSLDAGIPMSVYIWKYDHWELYDSYSVTGPMAFRTNVLNINLEGYMRPSLRIKLEWGKYFWIVNQVGIDFSPFTMTTQKKFHCTSAIDQHQRDVTNLITSDDKLYLNQLNMGDQATLTFQLDKEDPNQHYSYFLHSKGYYEVVQASKGRVQKDILKRFERPAHFKLFSLQTYKRH